MKREEIKSTLEFENEMMLFDPTTGEKIFPEELNETNKKCYDAHKAVIAFLSEGKPLEEKHKYSNYIMSCLRQRRGLNENDISEDKEISLYSPREIFSEVLCWEGIGSMSYVILCYLDEIFGTNFHEGR